MLWFGKKDRQKQETSVQAEAASDATSGRVLLVVDGSQLALNALDYALELSRAMNADLLAVYVVDTGAMEYLVKMRVILPEEREEFQEEMEEKGRRYLAMAKVEAKTEQIKTETYLAVGHFDQKIMEIVKERKVSLVVMGGWRQSAGTQDASSKARQLALDQVPCPVTIVK